VRSFEFILVFSLVDLRSLLGVLSFPFPLLGALILLDLNRRLQYSTLAFSLRLLLLRFVPFSFGISRFLRWVRGGFSARGSVVLRGGTLQSYFNGRFPALLVEANLSCCFRCL
jgi:hypothetical protein